MSTTCDFGSLPASVALVLSEHHRTSTRSSERPAVRSSHADHPTRIIPRASWLVDQGSWIRARGSEHHVRFSRILQSNGLADQLVPERPAWSRKRQRIKSRCLVQLLLSLGMQVAPLEHSSCIIKL